MARTTQHPQSADLRLPRTLLLATNLQQSILAELDRSGPIKLAYTAYGSQSSRLPVSTCLGFNGQLKEQPTRWYHLGNGHRVYNPVLMRFHSSDRLSPFGKGGLNSYVYCVGNPVNFTDPTGRSIEVPDWVQPVLTILLHIGIIGATVVTAINKQPSGLARWAARTTLLGSTTAITGSVLQLAGEKDIGKVLSAAGTGVSAVAVFTRAGLGTRDVRQHENPGSKVGSGLRNLFGFKQKPETPVPRVTPIRSSNEVRGGQTDVGGEQIEIGPMRTSQRSLQVETAEAIRKERRPSIFLHV